jgi:hypothetical protein
MAVHKGGSRKGPQKRQGTKTSAASSASTDTIDQRLSAFAEQLGTLVGTLQNRAEELIDREALAKELSRLKDDASGLLDQLGSIASSVGARATGQQQRPAAATSNPGGKQTGRGPVDAPGKRHRPPPPQERVSRRASQPKGTQTPVKIGNAARRGRG